MKIKIILFFISISFARAQSKCFIIFDKTNNSSIPYTTIYQREVHYGFFADENGRFCLDNFQDSIEITALGYERKIINKNTLNKLDTIFLNIKTVELNELTVSIKRKKRKTKTLGFYHRDPLKILSSGFTPNSSFKVATFIQNSIDDEALIKKVFCDLIPKENEHVKTFRIRLRIFSNLNNLPNEDILIENTIQNVEVNKKKIEFDISNIGIILPKDGIWVSLECIGYTNNQNKFILIGDKQFGKYTLKDSKKFKVKSIERISPCFKTINDKVGNSADSNWSGNWKHIKYNPKLTFCIGVMVEY